MEGKCTIMINDSVHYYDRHADEFVNATVNVDMSCIYIEFEKYLKPGCRIMDLGCGSGRDSKYFVEKGYDVVAVDPSPAMCAKTREIVDVSTYTLKAEELNFEDEFDAIWACASLLHVERENQRAALNIICRALHQGGLLYCSWKYGSLDRTESSRRFIDYDEEMLGMLLDSIPKLELIKSWVTIDVRDDKSAQKWLNAIIRKIVG